MSRNPNYVPPEEFNRITSEPPEEFTNIGTGRLQVRREVAENLETYWCWGEGKLPQMYDSSTPKAAADQYARMFSLEYGAKIKVVHASHLLIYNIGVKHDRNSE